MHDIVRWHRARRRTGTAHAKTRAQVVGTGKKAWRQKGTGRARIKDRKAPHHVGGGVAHGPKKTDWSFKLNKKCKGFFLTQLPKLEERSIVDTFHS